MIRHAALPVLLLALAGCGPLISGGADVDRLHCLGEGAEGRCQTIWDRDLGDAYPAGRPERSSYSTQPTVIVPAEVQARSVPVTRTAEGVAPSTLPSACLIGDRAYPQGSQVVRVLPGQYRGFGIVNPQPANGQNKQELCTCGIAPGAGPFWSCI